MLDLEVDRRDLRHVRVVERDPRPLGPGEARLRIDSFGLTANNITYAVFGDAMGYWRFFPVPEDDAGANGDRHFGRVPVWGFADVVESSTPGVRPGTRVYGYLPMGEQLVVKPGRIDERGFADEAPHRQPLPGVYNRYSFTDTDTDPIHRHDREPQQMLLWPLFITSFVVDDFLAEHDLFRSTLVVISSASAKTSIAAASLLSRRGGVETVGLTSAANLAFVAGLGCYHGVFTYDDLVSVPARRACYVDVAGRGDLTRAVHDHFGDDLRYSMIVGDTHWEDRSGGVAQPGGPTPTLLFAPDQIARRRRQWGGDGFERAVADAWNRFVPWTDSWLVLRRASGAAEIETAYRRLVDGQVDPAAGHICTLRADGAPSAR